MGATLAAPGKIYRNREGGWITEAALTRWDEALRVRAAPGARQRLAKAGTRFLSLVREAAE